ncbi:hypothetical protein PPMP20_28150 [Paraburkholderia phymatum]|nr:hypothetical protein [Paraburkholderia phymatum]
MSSIVAAGATPRRGSIEIALNHADDPATIRINVLTTQQHVDEAIQGL